MTLLNILNEKVKKAFIKAGYDVDGNIVRLSDRPDLSQFQCNTALNKAKEFTSSKIIKKWQEVLENEK